MRLLALVFICLLALAAPVRAEYRAYELAITNAQTGQSRLVTTTLDHLQYPGYFPIANGEVVEIRSTWMCWRRSDYFKSICPNPNAEAAVPPAASGPTANSAPPPPAAP